MASGYQSPSAWWEYFSFHENGNPYVDTDSDTPVVAASLIHPGTSECGTDIIKAIVSSDASVQDIEVEIYDVTNSKQVAIVSVSLAPDSPTIVDLGTISNLSAEEAVWEVRYRRSSGTGFVRLHSMSIRRHSS